MSETGMSNYQYTIALMIFLVAYGLFEVPSNGSYYYSIPHSLNLRQNHG